MDGNYVALAVSLIIWIGLFAYLLRLDRKVRELNEREG
jgi:CcmD family protein